MVSRKPLFRRAGPEELTDEVAEQILAAIEVAAPDSLIEPSARTGRAPQLSFAC